jgi:cellulose synthase/poly-beta-1,6-N-acetylglucosamine synthase-like glycosyltransferase
MMSVEYLVHILLWLLGIVFFFSVTVCKSYQVNASRPKVSIIIPARNEETNVPILLKSLQGQIKAGDEILVVDDHSEDNTAAVAKKSGATVIKSKEMPKGWTGKTWACHQGAQAALGDILIPDGFTQKSDVGNSY